LYARWHHAASSQQWESSPPGETFEGEVADKAQVPTTSDIIRELYQP
jgi:hypothetical protein